MGFCEEVRAKSTPSTPYARVDTPGQRKEEPARCLFPRRELNLGSTGIALGAGRVPADDSGEMPDFRVT